MFFLWTSPCRKKIFGRKLESYSPALAETDFEFVKSCYGQIITPKLATGVHFSASRVLGLTGQGSIYIRPECDISASLCSDTDSPPQSPDPDSLFFNYCDTCVCYCGDHNSLGL